MKISVLVDDNSIKNFSSEHGLSLLIESNNKKIIFDTGKSDLFLKNLKKLNYSIDNIDYLFVSHGHYDHMGGLFYLDNNFLREKTYISSYAINTFYGSAMGIKKEVSPNDLVISKGQIANKIKNSRNTPIEISENIFLLSVPYKNNNGDVFYKKYLDDILIDDFSHEMLLVIKEENKYFIFTGCSHCGINSILVSVKKIFNTSNIEAIIGGLHCKNFYLNPSKLNSLANQLKSHNVQKFILGHCTGTISRTILKSKLKNVENLATGKIFEF